MRVSWPAVILISIVPINGAIAQNVSNASSDWNNNWGFSSPADKQIRLLQSDLIEKKEEGYYESLGKISVTNNVTYDYSTGGVDVVAGENATIDITNRTGDDIGQNTNVVGAINAPNIEIVGDGNVVDAINEAISNGCQNGSVIIDSPSSPTAPASCD